jgi:signal transduction histidine kinase
MDLTTFVARRWWLAPLLFVVVGGTVAVNLGSPAPVVAGVAAGLVIVAIDWWLPAVLVNGALVGCYFAVGGDNGPVFFTIVAAAFLAASGARVRRWLPYVVTAAVLAWIGLLVRGLRYEDLTVNVWQSLGTGALVAAAAAVATARRSRTEARSARAERAATEERLRMAQELHDGVGHGLAVIAMQAGAALHVLERDPATARANLEAIRATSKESLELLRAELAAMSGEPARRRPASGLADLPALLDRVRSAGPRVRLVGSVPEQPLGGEADHAAYAVAQEALTNVLRHAEASSVEVRLDRTGDALVLAVVDDGRGGAVHDEGMGLTGMRDRVTALGGSFTAGPRAGGGFEVRAELPA